MRVFATKEFTKFARKENIEDQTLCNAAAEVAAGNFDADLGGSLYKKRVARQGQGKSSGYRLIVGYKDPHINRIVFLYGFPKNAVTCVKSASQNNDVTRCVVSGMDRMRS